MRAFIFFFLCLLLLESPSCEAANLIQDTCKRDSAINYTLCVTALESDPRSPTADLAGLGIISLQLALANATKTWPHILELLKSGQFNHYEKSCLSDCSKLYSRSISILKDSLEAFKDKRYTDISVWLGGTYTNARTCEESFTEVKGHVSPLTKENYYLLQLSIIALSIVDSLL